MIQTQCEKCGKRFRVDETKFPGRRAKFSCTVCQNTVYIAKPIPSISSWPRETPWHESTVILKRESFFDSGEWEKKRITLAEEEKTSRFGFASKLLTLTVLLALVPLIIFFVIHLKQMQNQMKTHAEQELAQGTGTLANQIDTWFEKNMHLLQAAAQLPDMVSMNRHYQEPVLRAIQQTGSWIQDLFTLDLNGSNIARLEKKTADNSLQPSSYKDILNGRQFGWRTIQNPETGEATLILAVSIQQNGNRIGILALASSLKEISNPIADWRQGETGRAFLLDYTGAIIAPAFSPAPVQKNMGHQALVTAFKRGFQGSIHLKDNQGVESMAYVKRSPIGWGLISYQEIKDALAPLKKSESWTYRFFEIMLLVVLLIAWLGTRLFYKPVSKLTRLANQVSMGDLNVEIPVDAKDEIGQLFRALSRMQTSMKLSISALQGED